MPTEALRLGESRDYIDTDSRAQHQQYSASMASQVRFSLDIASRQLDPEVFNQSAFLDAVRDIVVARPKLRIRILVHEVRVIASRGHRLVAMAQRLPSFIELRVPGREFEHYNHGLVLADEQGYIYREKSDRYEGVICFNDPAQTRYYTHQFDRMWDTAQPDVNLRRISL